MISSIPPLGPQVFKMWCRNAERFETSWSETACFCAVDACMHASIATEHRSCQPAGGEISELSRLDLVMRGPDEKADREIGRQAGRAFGLVRRRALIPAGVTKAEIEQRLRSGVLLLEYPGIYRVGHRAPSVEASYLAAVWACGDKALLSGRAPPPPPSLIKGPAAAPRAATAA